MRILFSLLALLLSACATKPAEPVDWQQYTSSEEQQIRSLSLSRFEIASRDQVIVWDGINKAYLLTTTTGCFLDSTLPALAFSRGNALIRVRSDAVLYGGQRCTIKRIQGLDVLKMRQDNLTP
ncbi:DUF6491 family protein [Gallaecimonas pentaromativorans]|uniref:Lipoprotein n=1 Tax=Gallaecimonas pentaromativorans TaxID=584787 RepID=A0A3N1PPE3_9GAMM|nr:DUF6491 family protein [Gallaecimonas pentaromativorans]MED5523189.1 DUF6491 family protein [Pseudomonadota bacterium]ROQ30383.1 hypothetical protein EDC28_10169 [Gallaecimonas pentaromativorans]